MLDLWLSLHNKSFWFCNTSNSLITQILRSSGNALCHKLKTNNKDKLSSAQGRHPANQRWWQRQPTLFILTTLGIGRKVYDFPELAHLSSPHHVLCTGGRHVSLMSTDNPVQTNQTACCTTSARSSGGHRPAWTPQRWLSERCCVSSS